MELDISTIALVLFVLLAFTTEAALGFGATLVAVTLGALVTPVERMLPAFVPMNVLLSLRLAIVNRAHIRVRLLLRDIVLPMIFGMPLGLFAFATLDPNLLVRIFGAVVLVLSVAEIILRRQNASPAPLPAPLAFGLLVIAGVMHGAFGTGGPMVVYVSGRLLPEKAEFRATLSALWFLLNLVLVTSHVVAGRVNADTGILFLAFIPALFGGLFVGNILHDRIPAEAFRRVVFVMLAVVGVVLLLR